MPETGQVENFLRQEDRHEAVERLPPFLGQKSRPAAKDPVENGDLVKLVTAHFGVSDPYHSSTISRRCTVSRRGIGFATGRASGDDRRNWNCNETSPLILCLQSWKRRCGGRFVL